MRKVVLLALLSVSLFALDAHAQYFGRNKVQWERFDFKVLKTEHFDIYYYDREADVVNNRRRFNLELMPLWIVEGMAEYLSKGRIDPLTAMWIRDATLHDRLPDIKKLTRDPRYFPYRYGQALLAYMGGRFGDDAVIRY